MAGSKLSGTTALVTGATRGFGRAIAVAFHDAGADVVAVARNAELLDQLRSELGPSLTIVAADVADPVVAGSLIERYRPKTLVLNAGAPPLMRPIQHQTWPAFSRNWEVDGIDVDEFVKKLGPALGPEHVGRHTADLASSTDHGPGAYLLTPDGLSLVP